MGVVIIALLGLFVGGAVTIAGIYEVTRIQNIDSTQQAAYGIAITIYGLYALMSLLALVGAIARKRGLIRAFFVFLTVHVILSIISGSFFLYALFQNAPAAVNECITTTTASMPREACQKAVDIYKGLAVGIFIFVWLMEIWGCVIVNDYTKQLEEEEVVRRKDAAYLNA